MLFNSYSFIFLFLPITLGIYFGLNRYRWFFWSKSWLLLMSLVFYAHYKKTHLPIILGSILFNYLAGKLLSKPASTLKPLLKKLFLIISISANLGLLCYFKYMDFIILNINALTGWHFSSLNLLLPLGISFFTFTQIAYLVDAYKGSITHHDPLNYGLFVTFFPHLLAGPILHHKQMIDQFYEEKNKQINFENIAQGLFLFTLGLSKKLLIADYFGIYANAGFSSTHILNMAEGWATSVSYALQLYFDFSGYTDMALGASLMFNILLPINFNSPYKALSFQDFWRRWHITLSNFLRDYVYIPLGGSRKGEIRTYCNLILTFLIGGLWHGAGWTFIFWGLLHGIGLALHRAWQKLHYSMPTLLAWFLTFNFINLGWIFFRAKDFSSALNIIKSMIGLNGLPSPSMSLSHMDGSWLLIIMILIGMVVCVGFKNSQELTAQFKPTPKYALITAILLTTCILCLRTYSEFLYFRF
jgi:alginate O-acetyltransferase complex protein AlgI